jgi:hypothetical protein
MDSTKEKESVHTTQNKSTTKVAFAIFRLHIVYLFSTYHALSNENTIP